MMSICTWAFVLFFIIIPVWSTKASPSRALEANHRRNVFWAGGEYLFSAAVNGTILVKQMYTEQLTPLKGVKHPYPLLFLHGGGVSGTQWLNKPDGTRGWASYFLDKGYEVFIVDIWSVGRSTALDLPAVRSGQTTELAQLAFTAPELSQKYYQAKFHTQWPGTGVRGDPAFDAFFAETLPVSVSPTQQAITRDSICAVLKRAGPSIFVSHSFGTSVGLIGADACPELVKGHVTYEGDQPPFGVYNIGVLGELKPIPGRRPYGIADIPVAYDPPISDPSQLNKVETGKLELIDGKLARYPCFAQANNATSRPRKLINIAKSPILHLTGQASVHILYDHCQVQYLQQAGVNVKFTLLEDIGLFGNGHFGMLEKNSDAIARYIATWLRGIE